ncbi:hypothetical protein A5893_09425 [Pedobacter psychrophilus]|uniref:PKD domain-containing protein n=1 Tax=Pedobacter psychrophilus TaxID=1826909 RepID=A0A179DFF9_9SPHI|nr:PKD domain-containing protein [Pedobacter psychrophilus]OAQ39787.1 hypothetical protein A5893_09425 [Pedobacter psychrophilus]
MLQKINSKRLINMLGIASLFFIISSCDYKEVGDAPYASQKIYIPAAAVADGGANLNLPYSINTVAVPERDFRYVINNTTNRFNVPLGVYRSGANLGGAVNVTITTPADTIGRLITAGTLTNTVLIPSDKFTIEPSVTVKDGSDFEPFTLSIDLPYLLANTTRNYAIAVKVGSATVASNVKYSTVIIVINPAFLIPTASFTSTVNVVNNAGTITRTAVFNNTSTNGVSFSWNFGDGSPAVTTRSPSRVYAAAGTYRVRLTTTGAVGTSNQVFAEADVVVP